MSQNDIEQIKTWGQDYELSPSKQVWKAVESKLAADELRSTVVMHKWLAIAASLVAIVAITTLWLAIPQQHVVTSDYQLEQLDEADEQLYSLKTILLLRDITYGDHRLGEQ